MEDGVRLGLALANEGPLRDTVALAVRAEELGLREVWVPESSHGRSVTSAVATLAANTRQIGLGVGVVNPFWRHPSLIAMEAATLDEASDGRLRGIGLGAGLWTLRALGEADQRTRRPLAAMVEAIGVVRAMLRDEPSPAAEVFTVRPDAALSFTPLRRDIPIYVGAVNRCMLRATGALADGAYLGAITSPGYTAWAAAQVAAGAAGAGRQPASVDLIANVLTSVSVDARAARSAVKPVLAYYLWRVDGVVVAQSGADPLAVAEVRRTVAEQGVQAGAARVGDHLVDVFAAAGDPDQVAERLGAYAEAGLKGALAWHVLGPDPDAGLRLLATEVWPLLQRQGS
jgi:5,10-methylenetetrahydromethanopterin reductase